MNVAAADTAADPVFNPTPKANDRRGWTIQNFGPVGIGIQLEKGFVMKINNVEPGSPAAETGQLEKGQVIESINGVRFNDIDRDPRIVLAQMITDAEASDGRIVLDIQDLGDVTVTIPVLGSYSPTWPLNCPKSDKIVRHLADLLAKQGENEWGSVIFLLSTGNEKDLDVVRGWMKKRKEIGSINWAIGMQGIGICEYYLRTGDQSVLPMIQKGADHLRDHIYNGAWAGRASGQYTYQSGGHVNASGVHCLTFLLLAKTCGVDVDEFTLQSSLRHFYRYSGRGSVPYGDYTSKAGYGDCNGKTSGLAMAMAAASRLTPGGDKSIYAQAAQINAMKGYYGINTYHVGHTGGGLGEIWKSAAMGLMMDERPEQYRQYLDARRWILELSRRHTGGIGIGGGKDGNYDVATGENSDKGWGSYFALNYTLPRKQLYLFGAPSQWAKSYKLPTRPWGTSRDDAFSSPYPVASGPWSRSDILKETLEQHVGEPAYEILRDDKVSDLNLVTYLHHPEITHRFEAKAAVVRLKKDDMILGLLLSRDARLKHIGVMALHDLFGTWNKRNADPGRVTPEMMAQVEKFIRDPHESWYVKQWSLGLLQHTDIDHLRTYKDLLVQYVEHEEHWIQGSAISASIRLLSDPACYKDLFPPIARAISKATAYPIVSRARFITEQLGDADPEIQAYGLNVMKTVYELQPNQMMSENGRNEIGGGGNFKRKAIGQVVGFSEAGKAYLDSTPKLTSEWKRSGRDQDKFTFSGTFQSNPDLHGTWCLINHDLVESRSDANDYIKGKIEKNQIPSMQPERMKYGFVINRDGQISPVGFTKQKFNFPMRYSGDMAFSTFIDKAYHYEVFTIGDREYLMFEEDFEAEEDSSYKAIYKTYVKVASSK
ncbi:hypothetical protein DDZ13_03710 [Coraliomargarita sinensis]|uniref:PDZ domain-containing protein n=1 Tax=Coraliomargarita sinensis TaxID=2174842 RepID=A0A317ZJB3_9BACT|nr:hypothetical protein DDZ13_03710 [Coraliomargarita sinensis]